MIKIIDYTKMTLKELEAEHTKQNQILLDMTTNSYYKEDKNGIKCFEMQKELVDYIYKKIGEKQRKISKMKGAK